ncbi:MAG TPA: acyl-CoA dehydrogenase family protein [Acidimicrobiales bacterium]|nr:acyl-CoA dehydrogenase family protein [Acidimicrobiales bacterium]
MHLQYDEETEAFRSELARWMEENLPSPEERSEPVRSSAHIPEWAKRWQQRLFDAGWLVPGWPPEYGGRNATPIQQMVYFEELVRLGVPRSCNPQGLSIITPSILDYGTEEQKRRYALPTLRAELAWCLGMSEPNAGSDLAGLRTRADLDGDHFLVNGQKVWTSGAHEADYCFCFVRTDQEAKKHAGISVLIIDMETPGIETRPIAELTNRDRADFNEVFFTDVVVPAENLVGQLHNGWTIAGASLAHERGMLWINDSAGLDRMLRRVLESGKQVLPGGRRVADDPMFRDMVARAYIQSQTLKLLGYRGFSKFAKGLASPEHSVLKLLGSECRRNLALDVAEALCAPGMDLDRSDAPPLARGRDETWIEHWMQAFSGTIAGGTSEIQRNIIAERVLGLPRR